MSNRKGLQVGDHSIEGISIAGHETCIIPPSYNLAFDIGKCTQHAICQQFLFISHHHMDHIGGLPMYVATRDLYGMSPPTVIVPKCIKQNVEKLFEAHRAMDGSELNHKLIGEEVYLRKDIKAKPFKTYHRIPSQGYIIYSVKQKRKEDYVGRSADVIKELKLSGVESTYVDDMMTVEKARDYRHTHISEIIQHDDKFENKSILLIHFSARHKLDAIKKAVADLEPPLAGRVYALT